MTKRRAESLEQYLEFGKNPLKNQLMSWATQQMQRPGPWVIRMTTEADGMPHAPVYQQVFTEIHPDIIPGIIEDLRTAVCNRHGAMPMAKIRLQAYMEGEASDNVAHVHRTQTVAPAPGSSTSGMEFGTNEYAWGVVTMLVNNLMQSQAHIVNVSGHLAAAHAATSNALATTASVRAVGNTAADMTSGGPVGAVMGLVAPAVLAYLWPDIKKILEDRNEGDSTLAGLLKLFSATTSQALMSTQGNTEVQKRVTSKVIGTSLDELQPTTFSWFDEDGNEHEGEIGDSPDDFAALDEDLPEATPSGSQSVEDFVRMAEQDPELVAQFIDQAGPNVSAWFAQNALSLMTRLTK